MIFWRRLFMSSALFVLRRTPETLTVNRLFLEIGYGAGQFAAGLIIFQQRFLVNQLLENHIL